MSSTNGCLRSPKGGVARKLAVLFTGVLLICGASSGAWAQQAHGLLGQYFSWDSTLSCPPDRESVYTPANLRWTQIDSTVDLSNAPSTVGNDNFGTRWTGYVVAPTTGDYQFTGRSDDGLRIWIGKTPSSTINPADPGTPDVESWAAQGEGADYAPVTVSMTAGQKYPVMIEFVECGGGQGARFRYIAPDATASAIVPSSMLVPPTTGDTTAPAAITDLKTSSITAGSVTLGWTAPGDDGTTGTATGYEVRYAPWPINSANFANATLVGIIPVPKAAGTAETLVVNLEPLQKYYLAIESVDDSGNRSAISNTPDAQTLAANSVPELPTLPKVADGDKAVYYDLDYSTGWISDSDGAKIRDLLVGKGYKLVTATELADFMTSHVASKKPSVVVFARDNMPETVVDVTSGTVVAENLLNDYMNNGGRVVWPQDIPLWDIAVAGGTKLNVQAAGGTTVLGVSGGTWDLNDTAMPTPAGVALGLTATWKSGRPTKASDVHLVLDSSQGGASAWMKFFPDNKGTGFFARLFDHSGTLSDAEIADLQTIAELPPAAATARGRLNGTVNDPSGAPLAGVIVKLTPASGASLSATTDGNGFYSFTAAPGTYTLSGSGATPYGVKGTISGTTSITDAAVTAAPTLTCTPETLPTFPTVATADKAVYYDAGYTTGWTMDAAAQGIRDYFQGKGYTVLDAAGLATFMTSHVSSKKASVVVGAQDILPDTVIDISSGAVVKTNLFNNYLNAGGRWMAFGDIPFYNIGKSDFTNYSPGDNGSVTILGLSAGGGARDKNDTSVITAVGTELGLTSTWSSLRPALVGDVDLVLESAQGGAAGWVKLYPDNTGTGFFARISDYNIGTGPVPDAQLADAQKIAELNGTIKVGGTTPPPATVIYGDLNGDKKTNITDVVTALRGVAGLVTLTADQQTAGDVNGDKKFSITDVVLMLRYVAGLITRFPVEG